MIRLPVYCFEGEACVQLRKTTVRREDHMGWKPAAELAFLDRAGTRVVEAQHYHRNTFHTGRLATHDAVGRFVLVEGYVAPRLLIFCTRFDVPVVPCHACRPARTS